MNEPALTSRHDGDTDHAVIVIGGHPPDRRVLGFLPAVHTVICADSGLDHALRLGLDPRIVIGDMDSVDPSSLSTIRTRNCEIHEHPTDKDFTDTELALEFAVTRGFHTVSLVWGGGDRIDHVLGVFAALGHRRLARLDRLEAWIATDKIDVIHAGRRVCFDYRADTTVSLLALGPESMATTTGLKWNLDSDLVALDRARGLSNVVVSSPVSIHCDEGVVALVTPDLLSENRR